MSVELTPAEQSADRAMIERFHAVWPDFCRAIGLCEADPLRSALSTGLSAAALIGPRGRVAQAARFSAVGVGAVMPSDRVPALLGAWPTTLGPAIGIDASWTTMTDLESRLPLLSQHLGIGRCDGAYVAAGASPLDRALLMIIPVVRERVLETRAAAWIDGDRTSTDPSAAPGPESVGTSWLDAIDGGADGDA